MRGSPARLFLLLFAFALAATPFSLEGDAAAGRVTPLQRNLLRNPGAEVDKADPNAAHVKPRSWQITGRFSVIAYGTTGFPKRLEGRRIRGGQNFFAGGTTRRATAAQLIPLQGRAAAIDAGVLRVRLGAHMASVGSDTAKVILQFRNGSNGVISRVQLAPVKNTGGRFVRREVVRRIPARTRSLRIIVSATGSGPYNNAYFDNLLVSLLSWPPQSNGYHLERVLPAADFAWMVDLVSIPGSNAVAIATQDGKIYRLPLAGGGASLMGDLRSRMADSLQTEEGLLGIAFSPNFTKDRYLYVHYTGDRWGGHRTVLSRFKVPRTAINMQSEQVLLQVDQPYYNHNGGGLRFGPDGYLYLALGDGGSSGDPQGNGQDLGTLLSKLLRLDVSAPGGYRIPPDNPFAGAGGARGEIWAYGLRNMWRFSFDRQGGQLWGADVGQDRWEEVNRIVRGGNYGWSVLEGFECFKSSNCDRSGKIAPRTVYGHDQGCSVTGGHVYRGPSLPELDGYYVYGDYCTGRIWAVKTAGTTNPVLLMDSPYSISAFGELPDGELIIVTFNRGLYKVVRD